jgi:superfamily II RNA helicase
MSTYLVEPDLTTEPSTYPSSVPFSFPLDPFQKHAVSAMFQGHNCLIAAKTGSGKTLAAEYLIHRTLELGKTVFYTTPIKSLSNQKFHDLTEQYPHASVGIMTGDIKFKPDAQIIVMTTEILRNLLFKKGTKTQTLGLTASLSIDNLGSIVFDECHYIKDPDRGKVWEETMILAPPSVQLLLLSATLERPDLFARWLGDLKKVPVHLIQTQYRIVPLTHGVLHPITDEFLTVLTPTKEVFQDKTYRDYLATIKAIHEGHAAFKDKVHNKLISGEKGPVDGKIRPKTFVHQLNHTVALLRDRNQLPALFFVLSRKGCEDFAHQITHKLIDSSDSANVGHIIDAQLHRYKSLATLPQYHALRDLLVKGIAFHHSGMLPLLKEIVEILFSKGLVKVLFATETFAVGLNMPTKTVVFTGLKKYDDHAKGMRLLRTDEYTQMAGRAGRRGKDAEGLVLYLPDREPVSAFELQQIMKGSGTPIISQMTFHYDFLLKTLHSGNSTWLELMEQSYWFQQRLASIQGNAKDIQALENRLVPLKASLTTDQIDLCEQKIGMEATLKTLGGNKQKKAKQELDKWLAIHWSTPLSYSLINYEALKKLETELATLQAYDTSLKAHADNLGPTVAFLRAADYLKESEGSPQALTKADLTLKGILATEINEGQPFLMTELFLSKAAHTLDGPGLAALLSVFLEDYDKDWTMSLKDVSIPNDIKDVMEQVGVNADRLGDLEYKIGSAKSDKLWNLSLQWAEPIYRWLTEPDLPLATICTDYGTFEGNFARGLLKLGNLLDEWLCLATFCEHTEQIEIIGTLKSQVIRDLVVPDSLYLRL